MRNDLGTDETVVTDEMAVFGTHPYKRSHGLARRLCDSLACLRNSRIATLCTSRSRRALPGDSNSLVEERNTQQLHLVTSSGRRLYVGGTEGLMPRHWVAAGRAVPGYPWVTR